MFTARQTSDTCSNKEEAKSFWFKGKNPATTPFIKSPETHHKKFIHILNSTAVYLKINEI